MDLKDTDATAKRREENGERRLVEGYLTTREKEPSITAPHVTVRDGFPASFGGHPLGRIASQK